MTRARTTRRVTAAALLALSALLAGCGEDDFQNEPRPPIPLQLTGVINDSGVTISPSTVGAGPIVLTISNQTDEPHTLALDGENVIERVDSPVDPGETATIQRTLEPGAYEVRAGSPEATVREIPPGRLTIGPRRDTSSDDTLLP